MSSPSHPIVIYDEESTVESEDAFLGFVNYARSVLSSEEKIDSDREEEDRKPSWSWIVSRILKTCSAYSSGVTSAILLSDLFQALSISSSSSSSCISFHFRVFDSFLFSNLIVQLMFCVDVAWNLGIKLRSVLEMA